MRAEGHKAVILAGGEGARLRPLTQTRPKPMIPIGPHPPIHYVLSHLAGEGFTHVIMVVGYLRSQIMGYVGNGSRYGLDVTYVVEPGNPFFGTAGSLKLAEHLLDETFLVTQADTITEMPLGEMIRFHQRNRGLGSIGLMQVPDPSIYGAVVLGESDLVVQFQEKPRPEEALSNLVSTGFYVFEPEILDYIEDVKWDFGRDVFPHLMNLGKRISGFVSNSFWVDVGGLEGFLKGTRWVLNELMSNPAAGLKVIDYGEGAILTGKDVTIGEGAIIEGPSLIEEGVTINDGAIVRPYTIIKENVSVGQGTSLDGSAILERVELGRGCIIGSSVVGETATLGRQVRVDGSIVGPGCTISDRATVSSGSRIWPNVHIGAGENVNGVVAVPREKAFYFYTGLGQYTGILASSIDELITALNRVPQESILFHLERRDFEKWVRDVLASQKLADAIEEVRKMGQKDEVRQSLVGVMTTCKEDSMRSNGVSWKEERRLESYVARHL